MTRRDRWILGGAIAAVCLIVALISVDYRMLQAGPDFQATEYRISKPPPDAKPGGVVIVKLPCDAIVRLPKGQEDEWLRAGCNDFVHTITDHEPDKWVFALRRPNGP